MKDLKPILDIFNLRKIYENDRDNFEKIKDIFKDVAIYNIKYGISVDNVYAYDDKILEFSITLPEHSEFKSDRGFEMCGIYLANQFKTEISNALEKVSNILELSKRPRIKVRYTSIMGSSFTSEQSERELSRILLDEFYPFEKREIMEE